MKLRRPGSGGANFESKMDMTPLIDCIFQLILFLVLTSQITIQAEEVELPFALEGKEADKIKDEVPPLIINVVVDPKPAPGEERKGKIIYGGNNFGNDLQKLVKELRQEVVYDATEIGRNRGYEPGPGRNLSKLSALVRADKAVRAEYIRTIFMACQEVGIWRVRVSSTIPSA